MKCCLHCKSPKLLKSRPNFCSKFCEDAYTIEHDPQSVWRGAGKRPRWGKAQANFDYYGNNQT